MSVNPNAFTYSRHICTVGYSSIDVWDFKRKEPKEGFIELGRVKSSQLPMRPRPSGEAAMLEDEDGVRFWLHITE